MPIFFSTRWERDNSKKYGRNASYHAFDWNAWNSPTLPLGTAACKDSATLLRENLPSLHVGGAGADDADHHEFTDTDDTWSGLRHERQRQRNQIPLSSWYLSQQTQHRAVLQILYSLGHRLSSDSTRTRRGSSALLWFSTQVLQSFFYKFKGQMTSARPVPWHGPVQLAVSDCSSDFPKSGIGCFVALHSRTLSLMSSLGPSQFQPRHQ